MITDAIKSIVEAEDASAAEIKQAEAKRAEIVADAQARADSVRSKGAEKARKYLVEQGAEATEQANAETLQKQNDAYRQIDAEISDVNTEEAVKLVLSKLI